VKDEERTKAKKTKPQRKGNETKSQAVSERALNVLDQKGVDVLICLSRAFTPEPPFCYHASSH
jgi:hypothetical protein